jgi:NAD(P)-dependent dehydrogenase (short-subunit alcohol dehydrogenase family)
MGCRTLVSETDVSKPSAIDKAIERTLEEFGHIDILINNAGIRHPSVSILDLDLDYLEKVVDVDFKGVYFCSRRVGQEMVKQGSGSIVNIASIAGLTSFPLPVYGPMKSAVIMLTQVLARDWAPKGVRVNAIAPGFVLTPLQQRLFEAEPQRRNNLLNSIPMKELIMPADIAFAAVFLCSDKARFITGVSLPVDAGVLSVGVWKAYGYD